MIQLTIFKFLVIWPEPTHPPTHQTIHPSMGGGASTDCIWTDSGDTPCGWGWVDEGGGGERVPPIHVHMHVHACTCTYDIIGNSQGFAQWGWPFASNYHVYQACMCVCMCACMCMHVQVCGRHPQPPPIPIHPAPSRRAAGSQKHQNSITLELIEIIQFCLKILYLWTFLNWYRL